LTVERFNLPGTQETIQILDCAGASDKKFGEGA